MFLKSVQAILSCYFVYVFAFEDVLYAYGQNTNDMIDKGKEQYQLLQERGRLPKHGNCWKLAIEHTEEGCKVLSEETQSDVALHLTNCFLEMSGHETYNCVMDKKPNLRGICINSMTDRAFNVYIEFYTHVQNICWFLRGQLWQETIADNTFKVGKQLKASAKNQEKLLQNQEETLQLQEKLMQYGGELERILETFLKSTKQHQEILSVMGQSLSNLQEFLLGEISWFDTLIFYVSIAILTFFITANDRTISARFPVYILLTLNIFLERFICQNLNYFEDVLEINRNYQKYVWYLRYFFIFFAIQAVLLSIYFYKNYEHENYRLLTKLHEKLENMTDLSLENTQSNGLKVASNRINSSVNVFETSEPKMIYNKPMNGFRVNYERERSETPKENIPIHKTPLSELQLNYNRYNLRSRQGTPEV